MTTAAPSIDRSFQAEFRPLVQAAWDRHCKLFAATVIPSDKIAREAWYRATLLEVLKTTDTTRDLSPVQKKNVLSHFAFLARGCDARAAGAPASAPAARPARLQIKVAGWSENQVARFNELAVRAHAVDSKRRPVMPPVEEWARTEFERVLKGPPEGRSGMFTGERDWNKTGNFDSIMEHFGVIAQDRFWMARTSAGSERRMTHQLMRFLVDLAWIEHRYTVSWEYVRSIYKQSDLSPEIEDCPAKTLQLVLGMLDTRIRKLCKKIDLPPSGLPTRRAQGSSDESIDLQHLWDYYHGAVKRWPNRRRIRPESGVCAQCGCAKGAGDDEDPSEVCFGCEAVESAAPF
jgi:hypothetical protein